MKRFWVFVIISIVALGIGFTVFRFMSKDEILYVNQTVFEVNSGENIKLSVVSENLKAGTTITATSNNESIIEKVNDFEFKAKNGGSTTITVTSNKAGFLPVNIQITVGDGNSATPFFIKNAADLAKIGTERIEGGESLIYPLTSNYKLTADFSLSSDSWVAIGVNDDAGFTGVFDFNGHTISNLNIATATNGYASLFAKIGNGGYIKGASIYSSTISADANYSAVVAGINYGTIETATIRNVNISNARENAYVGGIVGLNKGIITKSLVLNDAAKLIVARGNGSVAGGVAGASIIETINDVVSITRCGAETSVSAVEAVGGVVGYNKGAIIENCYAGSISNDFVITAAVSTKAGGVVGHNEYASIGSSSAIRSYVADTYSAMQFANLSSSNFGGIIGKNDNFDSDVNYNVIYGNYYSSEINNGMNGIGLDSTPATTDELGIYAKTTDELKNQSTYYSFRNENGINNYWQFNEGVWSINSENGLPKLTFAVNYVSSRVQNFASPNEVNNSNFVSKLTNADTHTIYKLTSNIVLKSQEGFVPFDFNGKLYCPLDDNGEPQFKITLIIDTESGVNNGYATIFSKLGQGAQLENIKVEATIGDILTADHISALVGLNQGNLENCSATGTLTTGKSSDTIYISGLVAENNGNINNSKSSVFIDYSSSPNLIYAGGICAYNTSTIQNVNNIGNISILSSNEAFIGGVTGYSSGAIAKSANRGSISGNLNAKDAYIGGIAAYLAQNANAKMTYCGSYGELYGSNVGGLVGISIGSIENCYSNASITGVKIGGLAYNIKQGTSNAPSYIKNSMTDNAQLFGENASSIVCGVVYQIDVIESHLAYCEKIFSSSRFSGDGKFYYETTSNIRGKSTWGQAPYIDENAFNNSIHVERSENIERQTSNFEFSWDNFFSIEWSFWLKGKHDIPVTEEQAKGSDNYKVFYDNNYKTSDWLFNPGEYPMIKDVAK